MIVCDTESKRVIDYNSIISEKLVNINKELSKEENSGFSFGLNSQSVDEALREGKIVGSVTDDEDENNNCIVGSICPNNTKCSIHGNCYYDIISLYKNNQSFIFRERRIIL